MIKRRFKAGLTALLLSGAMLVSCLGSLSFAVTSRAAVPGTRINRLGLQAPEAIDLGRTDVPVYTPRAYKSSSIYSGRYDSYSTNYIYNQLTSNERQFWDGLDAVCRSLLSTTEDAYDVGYYSSGYGNASTEFVKYSGMSSSRATDIMFLFRYTNPQYYFLDNSTWISGDARAFAFAVYDAFADGASRAVATADFTSTAESIISAASVYSSDEDKLIFFQKTITDMVTYDKDANDTDFRHSDNPYHQSAYSVFCDDYTVCAGYSMAMEYLCNGAGIDCTCVTSYTHQWNQVRLDDNWYNIDVTWADTDDPSLGVDYAYFLKSDSYYLSDRANASSHLPEDIWYGYLRSCVLDSSSGGSSPGSIPTVYSRVSDPLIIGSGDSYIITCDTPGSRIYYTTDGSEPYEASGRCYRYDGSITTSRPSALRAIAVADGFLQSATALYADPASDTDPAPSGSDTDTGSEVTTPSDETDHAAISLTSPVIQKLVNRKTRKLVVKVSGLGQATGYQIAYSLKKSSVGTKKKIGSTSTYTIRSLKKGKTYYVRVRTYATVGGKTIYSKWSTVKKIKITK